MRSKTMNEELIVAHWPGQPASATLTIQRRRLHSCHDYTAGKSGLAPNGPGAMSA
jgi:hypothetical protein